MHAKEYIQVSDVVKAVAVSRRGLYEKFRKFLGRSINQEIRRVRVKLVTRMLTETNVSIRQIAFTLGFTGVDHIARYFRKEKGMSLLEWRKKYLHKIVT